MKKDIELITTSSSAMKVSEGVGWGMEGDLFLYLVCGMLGSMFLMLALISFFHVSIFISFIIALLPVTGAVLYIKIFRMGKPPAYQKDLFELILMGDTATPHPAQQRNRPLNGDKTKGAGQ